MATTDTAALQEGKQEKSQEPAQKPSIYQGGDLAAAQAHFLEKNTPQQHGDSEKTPKTIEAIDAIKAHRPSQDLNMQGPGESGLRAYYAGIQLGKDQQTAIDNRAEAYKGDKGKDSLLPSKEAEKTPFSPENGATSEAFQRNSGNDLER